MDHFEKLLLKLPESLTAAIFSLPKKLQQELEEIRIKVGQPLVFYAGGMEQIVPIGHSGFVDKPYMDVICSSLLNHSVYAYQTALSNGYITIEGGHRIGFCGTAVVEKEEIRTLKDMTSLNIRRSRELIGISDGVYPFLTDERGCFFNTVLLSPPKCGKTTLLRDLIRNLSFHGFKVGVCDERSEIGGCDHGVLSYDLGLRTDVLDGCPKELGTTMLIRSMSPDIIATDEIGKKEDCTAISAALVSGVGLLTTIHGLRYADLLYSGIGSLVEKGVFQRIVYLGNYPRVGTILDITDEKNRSVIKKTHSCAQGGAG